MSGHFLPRVQARKDSTRKFLDKLGPMPEGQTKRGWTAKVFKMLIEAGADYEDNHAGYLLFAYDKMGHVGASKEGSKRMEYDGRVRRRTKEEIADFHKLVVDIVEEQKPMTVRAVYYQMEVRHPNIISKDDDGAYSKVQKALSVLRDTGKIDYDDIVDNSRRTINNATFDGIEDFFDTVRHWYDRNIWLDHNCRAEIWVEKDALSGVIEQETLPYGVPLRVARGFSSYSFSNIAAKEIAALDVPVYIYHLGDFDQYGVDAANAIEAKLKERAPDADIRFKPLALNPDQIRQWHLPTRRTKFYDKAGPNHARALEHGPIAAELDAIEPNMLRKLVRDAIKKHMPKKVFDAAKAKEEADRERIEEILDGIDFDR